MSMFDMFDDIGEKINNETNQLIESVNNARMEALSVMPNELYKYTERRYHDIIGDYVEWCDKADVTPYSYITMKSWLSIYSINDLENIDILLKKLLTK